MSMSPDYFHLVDINEQFYITQHPFDIRVVKVKKLLASVAEAEMVLKDVREQLDVAIEEMNVKREGG